MNIATTNKKRPKDDARHLAFSVTKNVVHHDDYSRLIRHRGYSEQKKRQEEELAEEVRRQGFWKTLENEIENESEEIVRDESGFVAVKRVAHQRSPYVVRLSGAGKTAEQAEPVKSPDKKNREPGWASEVERLQRAAAKNLRSRAQKIRINFLGQDRAPRLAAGATWAWLTRLRRLPLAIIVWLFELVLSIPLGVLLILHLLLKTIDLGTTHLAHLGRWGGRAVLFLVSETWLGLVAVLKAVFVIPIKFLALGSLLILRGLAATGAATGRIFLSLVRKVTHLATAIARSPFFFLRRALAAFLLAAVIILPLKFASEGASEVRALRGAVLGAAREALSTLGQGAQTLQQGQAGAAFAEAEFKFNQASRSLDDINLVLRGLVALTPQGQGAADILAAGEALSQAGQYLAMGLAPFTVGGSQNNNALGALKNLSSSLTLTLPYLQDARGRLEKINPAIVPEGYQEKFRQAQILLPKIALATDEFITLADDFMNLLGESGEKRYAVLFQNNNELRPAGGFIGSLALVLVRAGRIVKIEIPGGGSYDFQGALTKHVLAPKPLSLINPHWQLQDANWYPDWPTSAEKVAWFLEQAGESSVDGVIALQASTLEDLLRILGPIEFPEYNTTLTASNVIATIQAAVELGYDKKENKPKQYIAELTPRLLDKILASGGEEFLKIFQLVRLGLAQKEVLLYFRDRELNKKFIAQGWEPQMVGSDLDYLSAIHANIGGGKTDGVIEESWEQKIIIDRDGTVTAELALSRSHRGDPADHFTKANNVDFVRVYVPAGSVLLSASGFKPPAPELFEKAADYYVPDEQLTAIEGKVFIDEATGTRINNEFGKTVFGNWLQVGPGKTATGIWRYQLPFKIKPFSPLEKEGRSGYSLLIQKQVGARAIDFSIDMEYPEEWGIGWQKSAGDGNLQLVRPGLLNFDGQLVKDTGFAVLFKE